MLFNLIAGFIVVFSTFGYIPIPSTPGPVEHEIITFEQTEFPIPRQVLKNIKEEERFINKPVLSQTVDDPGLSLMTIQWSLVFVFAALTVFCLIMGFFRKDATY